MAASATTTSPSPYTGHGIVSLTLFGLAHVWSLFPHDGPTQLVMQTAHVSLGVILSAVVVVRLFWRSSFGRRPPPTGWSGPEVAARGMHYVLYALLIAMVVAGFGKRWVRQHGVEFVIWRIPPPFFLDPAWRPTLNWVHHWGAWAIMFVAGLHAGAALFHHYAIRDSVLVRMMPGRRRVGAH